MCLFLPWCSNWLIPRFHKSVRILITTRKKFSLKFRWWLSVKLRVTFMKISSELTEKMRSTLLVRSSYPLGNYASRVGSGFDIGYVSDAQMAWNVVNGADRRSCRYLILYFILSYCRHKSNFKNTWKTQYLCVGLVCQERPWGRENFWNFSDTSLTILCEAFWVNFG